MRRPTNDEPHKLILFPEDNTIAVVKSKWVHTSDRPNFVVVLAGNKKYDGTLLHEGKKQNYNRCVASASLP
jgi:hypothetical protein